MLNKMNGYFEEIKASKYQQKKKKKKLMKNWIKIRDLISQ